MDRKQQEDKVKAYAHAAIIVDIAPAVETHLGKVNMLDRESALMEDYAGDWIYRGELADLNDEEFDQVFRAVQANALKLLASVAQR